MGRPPAKLPNNAAPTHPSGYLRLDNAFVLIEGHPTAIGGTERKRLPVALDVIMPNDVFKQFSLSVLLLLLCLLLCFLFSVALPQ